MTNPAVLSRKEVDNWCRELRLENKELKKRVIKLELFLEKMLGDMSWVYEDFGYEDEKGD